MKKAVAQRLTSYTLDDGRAHFLDRHLRPLGIEKQWVLVVFPQAKSHLTQHREQQLVDILTAEKRTWDAFLRNLKSEARAWQNQSDKTPYALSPNQARQIRALNIKGLVVAEQTVRNRPSRVAKQLIGIVGENAQLLQKLYPHAMQNGERTMISPLGVTGLERSFEKRIAGIGQSKIAWYQPSTEIRMMKTIHADFPLRVLTTIDYDAQRQVERAMADLRVQQGSVVVLDRQNADIFVMASRPATDIRNHALIELTPGSIFKTVVALASLTEQKVTSDTLFDCDGSYGNYKFVCWRRAGHGKLTARQAYAHSCNIAFAEMARALSATAIERSAKSLGLASEVSWQSNDLKPLMEEQAGLIFANKTNRDDHGALIQTAIGQRDVRMTPLQAANMIVTILNEGQLMAPRVVREIQFRSGVTKERFASQIIHTTNPERRRASRILRTWMRDTVTIGTAQSLDSAGEYLEGKTGTAQVFDQGQKKVNQWFVGAVANRFAIAVVVENVHPEAPQQALPLTQRLLGILQNYAKK